MERDGQGRFAAGHANISPGRPRRAVEEKYHKALVGQVGLAEWQAIILVAVAQAKAGDPVARAWLANYLLGKPRERLDVSSADLPVAINIGWIPVRGESLTEVRGEGEEGIGV